MSMGQKSWAQKIAIVDVKRAFLHGEMQRELYVELTPEDPDYDNGASIGRLHKALY